MNEILKVGEVFLYKDEFKISLLCAECGVEVFILEEFLVHAIKRCMAMDVADIGLLIEKLADVEKKSPPQTLPHTTDKEGDDLVEDPIADKALLEYPVTDPPRDACIQDPLNTPLPPYIRDLLRSIDVRPAAPLTENKTVLAKATNPKSTRSRTKALANTTKTITTTIGAASTETPPEAKGSDAAQFAAGLDEDSSSSAEFVSAILEPSTGSDETPTLPTDALAPPEAEPEAPIELPAITLNIIPQTIVVKSIGGATKSPIQLAPGTPISLPKNLRIIPLRTPPVLGPVTPAAAVTVEPLSQTPSVITIGSSLQDLATNQIITRSSNVVAEEQRHPEPSEDEEFLPLEEAESEPFDLVVPLEPTAEESEDLIEQMELSPGEPGADETTESDGKPPRRSKKRAGEKVPAEYRPVPTADGYQCSLCKKLFRKKVNCISHLTSHNDKFLYECNICGARYKSKNTLGTHKVRHRAVKPHACDQCDSCFYTKAELRLHFDCVHLQERPYQCPECGKAFVRENMYRHHMKSHSAPERPFLCEQCGKTYITKQDLQMHELIHLPEKQFKCSECGKEFMRKKSMVEHMRRHTGESLNYECNICHKKFVTNRGRLSHIMIRHKNTSVISIEKTNE